MTVKFTTWKFLNWIDDFSIISLHISVLFANFEKNFCLTFKFRCYEKGTYVNGCNGSYGSVCFML